MKKKFRTEHDRKRHHAIHGEQVITEQSHAPQCDMKYVLHQYSTYGTLPIGKTRGEPIYMDCPDQEQDYKYTMDTIKRAESEFYKLPLDEQHKYENNPSEWLRGVLSDDFIDNFNPPEDTEAEADGSEAPSEASKTVETDNVSDP